MICDNLLLQQFFRFRQVDGQQGLRIIPDSRNSQVTKWFSICNDDARGLILRESFSLMRHFHV